MKNKKVIITDTRISYKDDDSKIVMDIVSKELMEFYSNIVTQNNGNVLDVGFGLGYSANAIYNKIGNYHCIESNPQIFEKAQKWADGKDNVYLYFGDWVDIIPTLEVKFDGIFMDTYDDSNYFKFEDYAKLISNENCVLSVFSYFALRDAKDLHSHYFEINSNHRKTYPKLIEKGHICNWSYFIGGQFKKKKINAII
jgi:SAM-dependent methyltransferase